MVIENIMPVNFINQFSNLNPHAIFICQRSIIEVKVGNANGW